MMAPFRDAWQPFLGVLRPKAPNPNCADLGAPEHKVEVADPFATTH